MGRQNINPHQLKAVLEETPIKNSSKLLTLNMKIIILFLSCMIFYYSSFSQNSPSKELSRENYLHKSKVTRIIGYSFLGTGAVLIITGSIIDQVKKPELWAGSGYEFIGISSTLVSIPFFISSSKSKRKALLFTLDTRKNVTYIQNIALQFVQPTVTFKIFF